MQERPGTSTVNHSEVPSKERINGLEHAMKTGIKTFSRVYSATAIVCPFRFEHGKSFSTVIYLEVPQVATLGTAVLRVYACLT